MFAHHRDVIEGIEAFLFRRRVYCIKIDGSTSGSKRQELVRQFQENPECRIALLGITAAGTGINLTAASACLFAEVRFGDIGLCAVAMLLFSKSSSTLRCNVDVLSFPVSVAAVLESWHTEPGRRPCPPHRAGGKVR